MFPNAAQYEVFVIDAGTASCCSMNSWPIRTSQLRLRCNRATLQLARNAIAADGGLLADGDSRFVVQP
jgi:hypothetical protein